MYGIVRGEPSENPHKNYVRWTYFGSCPTFSRLEIAHDASADGQLAVVPL